MTGRCAAAVLACALAACRAGGGPPADWPSRMVPVPEADLSRHDEATRARIGEARARVDRAVGAPGIAPADAAREYGELGRLYLAHDLWKAAAACLTNAAAADPADRRWPYLLGVIAQLEGRLDAAAPQFERALALAPDDGPTLVRLGQVELDRDQEGAARTRYERALSAPGMAPAAHFGLGRIAAAQDDLAGAVSHFEQALAAQPQASAVHNSLGLALRGLGRKEDAQRHLAQAGKVAVEFPDPLVDALSELVTTPRSQLARGAEAQRQGRTQDAVRYYRLAVEADPNLAPAHYSLGTLLGDQGDAAQAIVHLQRSVELDPTSPEAFLNLGTALARQGRAEEAIEAYGRALALDPDQHAARLRRAALRRDRGETSAARADLEKVLERDPLNVEALSTVSMLLAQDGRREEAAKVLRDALARRPPPEAAAQLQFTRAFLETQRGNLAGAIDAYREAIAAKPDYVDARFNLAVSLMMAGREAEAAPAFAGVARLQPGNPRAHLGLARAQARLGHWREARAALEAGLAQLPGDVSLAAALAEMLAGAGDPAVRDGRRALELATRVYGATHDAAHGETVGMALAEVGQFDEAARFQRSLLAQARAARAPADVRARLAANLARYERGEPVRLQP